MTLEPAIVCVSVKLRTGIVTSTPLTFPSLSTSIAPLKSGASFGTFETVLSDWLRCIVPPPVSNANDDVSSAVSGVSGVSPSSASYTALTFHVSSLIRSVTSRLSSTIPDTVCDAAFDRAAESAASSFSAPNTMYGISISVTSPLAFTVWSRSEYASSTLVVAMSFFSLIGKSSFRRRPCP